MRIFILLAGTALLTACGGAGPQSAGGTPPPSGGGTGTGDAHTFVNPTEPKTYKGVGASHSYSYETSDITDRQGKQLYAGNADTVRDSDITIKYNPRDAIFDIEIAANSANVSANLRFQDPLHRTDFGGAINPQGGVPNLNTPGIQYLEAGSSNNVAFTGGSDIVPVLVDTSQGGSYDVSTFFYQKPGTATKYVTFAGFLRNQATISRVDIPADQQVPGEPTFYTKQNVKLDRSVFTFGEVTANDKVPTRGTGSYEGAMLATMVYNDLPDATGNADTYFQWIEGTAKTEVDFGANLFTLAIDGTVRSPQLDLNTSGLFSIRGGASFNANGKGQIDLVRQGGFFGQFQQAWFVNPNGRRFDINIAGSSINGAFYGPNGEEVGGGYRIVGGTPDERIDILGTFVGREN
jgi:hypothetical protein